MREASSDCAKIPRPRERSRLAGARNREPQTASDAMVSLVCVSTSAGHGDSSKTSFQGRGNQNGTRTIDPRVFGWCGPRARPRNSDSAGKNDGLIRTIRGQDCLRMLYWIRRGQKKPEIGTRSWEWIDPPNPITGPKELLQCPNCQLLCVLPPFFHRS